MTFLPIVERELRVAARRGGTYWLRVGAGIAAMLICFWMLFALAGVLPPQTMGVNLFRALSGLAFTYCLLAGMRITADCLSEEKREGTLGLLFLTDLKGYDVVLGKLAATSLKALYGLVSIVPVLAIPILMGGVTLGDLARLSLILLNTLFFSLSAGIFVSAISQVERKAVGGTLLLILLFTAGPVILASVVPLFRTWNTFPEFLFLADPAYPFVLAVWPNSSAGPAASPVFLSSLVVHSFGWLFLWLASGITPRVWKDKVAAAKTVSSPGKLSGRWQGNEAERKELRVRLLAVNPVFWLSSRYRPAQFYPWVFLGAMLLIWLQGYLQLYKWWLETESAVAFILAMHLVFKLWVAHQAAYSFALDREKGALELLLSTPLKVREMVRGQWMALRRQFVAPVAAVIFFDLLLSWGALFHLKTDQRSFWLLFFASQIVMFLADLVTLGWVGLWMGVKRKSAGRAASATIGGVLLLPWAPLVVLGLVLLFAAFAGGRSNGNWPEVFTLIWFCLGLVTDAVFGAHAWSSLRQNLRTAATQRFETRRGRFEASTS